jgi:hypothetical protein
MNISFAIFLCREKTNIALLNPIDLLTINGKRRDGQSSAVYYLRALTLKRKIYYPILKIYYECQLYYNLFLYIKSLAFNRPKATCET